jgi:hypothetical protein
MKIYLSHSDLDYVLEFDEISLKTSNAIDYEVMSVSNNSFSECAAVLGLVEFKLYLNGEIKFDSCVNDFNKLDFPLAFKIYDIIKPHLYLSQKEKNYFIELCKKYLSEPQSSRMPFEILIAHNILNKSISMNLQELENMEVKKYEKIQLAVQLLKEQFQ